MNPFEEMESRLRDRPFEAPADLRDRVLAAAAAALQTPAAAPAASVGFPTGLAAAVAIAASFSLVAASSTIYAPAPAASAAQLATDESALRSLSPDLTAQDARHLELLSLAARDVAPIAPPAAPADFGHQSFLETGDAPWSMH